MENKYKFIIKKGKNGKYDLALKQIKNKYAIIDIPNIDMSELGMDVYSTTNKDLFNELIDFGFIMSLDEYKDLIESKTIIEEKNKNEKEEKRLSQKGGEFITEDGLFNYILFAQWLYEKSDHYFIRIRETDDVYYYKGGIYIPLGETYIEEIIQEVIGWDAPITTKHVTEIIGYMKRSCTCEIDIMSIKNNMVTCKNGVIDLRTKELLKHSPDNYSFHKIPWNYIPDTFCPEIELLLMKLIPESSQVDKIYSMVGYTLINSYIYNKIFFLFGPPGTGKTTITNIITNLLGVTSVSNVRLHDLITRPFMRVALLNSLVNFCGDASNRPIKDASILKILSGDGRMDVDMKNVAMPIKLQNYSKLIIDTNNMPEFDTRDSALHRRFVKIPFDVIVKESEKTTDFMGKFSTHKEMEGLLSLAVDAAHLILTTENPFKSMSIEDEQLDYETRVYGLVDNFISAHVSIIHDHPEDNIYTIQSAVWQKFKKFMDNNFIPHEQRIKTAGFYKQFYKKCNIDPAKTIRFNEKERKRFNRVNGNVYYNIKLHD